MTHISMAGIDFNKAAIGIREHFALTVAAQETLLQELRDRADVLGCVILSTCNRMELWVSTAPDATVRPFELLCTFFGVNGPDYARYFTQREGEEAVSHLFELACGLKSLIFGEEQILAQVKDAIAFAREHKASDPVLEAAFRRAVTAAKKAKTSVRLTGVDRSAAGTAVQFVKQRFGSLTGLQCLVIGSGEMGKLAARQLAAEGAVVYITLRQYKSGEATVPTGCRPLDYEDRYSRVKAARVIFSATRSPHYTLHREELSALGITEDKLFFDLAVPRDIEPDVGTLLHCELYDIDHLGGNLALDENNAGLSAVRAIIHEELRDFERWLQVRALMPKISGLGASAAADVDGRLRSSLRHLALDDSDHQLIHEAAKKAVAKVVENLLFSLQQQTEDGEVRSLMDNVAAPGGSVDAPYRQQLPPRFPLFVDLSGRKIAVIGAGAIALRRIESLLAYPCTITVTAPQAREEITQLAQAQKLTLRCKAYNPADIEGAYLVIAATDDRALNHEIAQTAARNGQHCSIADCKEECSFFFPATVHYDGGVIGICGTGDNHTKTRRLTSDIRDFMKTRDAI